MKPLNKPVTLLGLLAIFYASCGFAETIISQPDVRQYNLGLGKSVFQGKCSKCHIDLESEAPQLRSIPDWENRIATPLKSLIDHAINGHGKMPPRGGFETLTDREISAAVAYVVDQGRRLIINTNGNVALNTAGVCSDAGKQNCNSEQVDSSMLLQLLWLMTNPSQN